MVGTAGRVAVGGGTDVLVGRITTWVAVDSAGVEGLAELAGVAIAGGSVAEVGTGLGADATGVGVGSVAAGSSSSVQASPKLAIAASNRAVPGRIALFGVSQLSKLHILHSASFLQHTR